MYYSLNLLKTFLTLNDTPEHIANHLTLKSCEIEEIKDRQLPKDVLIAKVTDVRQHPDADKLVVCQVDCGAKGQYQICTGGTNVEKDTYVPVAIPGCYLPVIDLKIGERKMRGEDSNGMICSKEELGIMEDMDEHWIWTLQYCDGRPGSDFDDITDADIGMAFGDKYPWLNNTLLDVDNKTVTHRPDLTGHYGLATELFAIYHRHQVDALQFHTLNELYQRFADKQITTMLEGSKTAKRKIQADCDGCRAYTLLELNGIQVRESSFYLRTLLRDLWSEPKSNWVDFSNIFMNVSGNPVHFFDAAKVDGDIIIRYAQEGETFTDLFDKEHRLTAQDIVIADSKKLLALAGIVGSNTSGIDENTKDILVEIANFDPVSVRKTATRIGLRTDALMRYEKNINPVYSLHMLTMFMDQLKVHARDLDSYELGGVDRYIRDDFKQKISSPTMISLSLKTMFDRVGVGSEDEFAGAAREILSRLGFEVKENGDTWTVLVPHRRGPADISIPEDLHEEVVRVNGYDLVDHKTIASEVQVLPKPPLVALTRTIEETLSRDAHCDQVETYPWAEQKTLELFDVDTSKLLSLQNAVAPELQYMRDDMIYNLLEHTRKNHKFYDNFGIFDIGKVWKQSDETTNQECNELPSPERKPGTPSEYTQCGIILYNKNVSTRKEDNLLSMKGICNILGSRLGEKSFEYASTDKAQFHPKKQGTISIDGQVIGFVGTLHPLTLKQLKIDENTQVTYCSLNMETIVSLQKGRTTSASLQEKYETLQDQILTRDLCFVIDQDQTWEAVLDAVRGVEHVTGVSVFDLYQGEHLPAGKKSIALTIKIVGDGSMKTEDINAVMDAAIAAAKSAGGELR